MFSAQNVLLDGMTMIGGRFSMREIIYDAKSKGRGTKKMGVNYALAKWPRAEASSSERYHRRRSTDNYLIKSPALLPNWGHFVCLPACTPGPVHVTRTKRAAAACRRIKEARRARHAGQRGTIFMGQSFPNRQQGGRVHRVRRLSVVANLSPFYVERAAKAGAEAEAA